MATENDNTRNDGYIIINNKNNYISKVSYGVNLIDRINELNVLEDVMTKSDFKNFAQFREILSKLEAEEYLVYQLTQL